MNKETKQSPPTEAELTLMTVQLNLRLLRAEIELMERHMMKLDEVYYHVFPDRLAQDVKFAEQLLDLQKHFPGSKEQ